MSHEYSPLFLRVLDRRQGLSVSESVRAFSRVWKTFTWSAGASRAVHRPSDCGQRLTELQSSHICRYRNGRSGQSFDAYSPSLSGCHLSRHGRYNRVCAGTVGGLCCIRWQFNIIRHTAEPSPQPLLGSLSSFSSSGAACRQPPDRLLISRHLRGR